jgi:hypothetical protein
MLLNKRIKHFTKDKTSTPQFRMSSLFFPFFIPSINDCKLPWEQYSITINNVWEKNVLLAKGKIIFYLNDYSIL